MRTIRIPNPRLVNTERTFLDADYTVLDTTLTVVNNTNFATNDYAVIGEVGEEKTEQQLVAGITGATTITLTAPYYALNHTKTTPIYKSKWNQIILEYKVGSGNWTPITAFDIQWNNLETYYFHTVGDDTYSYRFKFSNSTTAVVSEYSPTVLGTGFTPLQVGAMIINVRRKLRDPNRQRFSDTDIIALLQQAQTDIQLRIPKLWFLKVDTFETGTGIAAIASQDVYDLSAYTDFLYLDKIKYQFVNGATTTLYDLSPLSDTEFDQFKQIVGQPEDDNVQRVKLLPPTTSNLQGSFKVDPIPKTSGVSTFYPVYYRKFSELNDVSDTTDLPFPQILEDYAAFRLHQLLGNKLQAEIYKKLYSGPNNASNEEPLTGIALLAVHNKNVQNVSTGYGKQLWRYRGRSGRSNFFGQGITNSDYRKEWYM